MKKFYQQFFRSYWLFSALMLLNPIISKSQIIRPGSLQHLFNENGFKEITLGNDISSTRGNLEYLDGKFNMDADSCIKYAYKNENILKLDSNNQFDLVAIRTYKNKIVEIYLFFNARDNYIVLRDFIEDYGQYTGKYAGYSNKYSWVARGVDLALYYSPDIDKGVAIYTSDTLLKTIEAAKVKRLSSNANGVAVTKSYTMP